MNRLKEIRNERGLSQLKLAFLTGIAPSELSRIENNWIKPYPGWRKRLAKALRTTEVELFPAEKGGSDAKL
jgi:putative transcriptional regulator